jgi:hypothetical protein
MACCRNVSRSLSSDSRTLSYSVISFDETYAFSAISWTFSCGVDEKYRRRIGDRSAAKVFNGSLALSVAARQAFRREKQHLSVSVAGRVAGQTAQVLDRNNELARTPNPMLQPGGR